MLHKFDQDSDRLAYSIEEISKSTGLSQGFLRNEVRAGRLNISRFGRRVLVLREDLHEYLRSGADSIQDTTAPTE